MSSKKNDVNRRNFLKKTMLVAVAVSVSGLKSCKEEDSINSIDNCATTKDILGPFYKGGAPFREDIIPSENTGAPLLLHGRVSGGCSTIIDGAIVEIWNANTEGVYDTSDAYKFRGRFKTESDGQYRFKTIIPGRYLNGGTFRPSHIHFRITALGYEELVSQIYFKDDPFISQDPWAGTSNAVERILTVSEGENGIDTITFDIYLKAIR
jgi:catechol 1,2-dioxygenase